MKENLIDMLMVGLVVLIAGIILAVLVDKAFRDYHYYRYKDVSELCKKAFGEEWEFLYAFDIGYSGTHCGNGTGEIKSF